MDFEKWKRAANAYCENLLGFACFVDGDIYDCEEVGREMFESGEVSPEGFVHEAFHEDLCEADYNDDLGQQALEYAEMESDIYD